MNKEVKYLTIKDIQKYINFIKEVFEYNIDSNSVKEIIKNNKVLIIKDNDKIIASAMLEERKEYIKNQKYYYLGYLGVIKEHRREGYATKLFEKIDELVKKNDIDYLELTSGNQRRIAHYFYASKDFKVKDTTVYVKLYK